MIEVGGRKRKTGKQYNSVIISKTKKSLLKKIESTNSCLNKMNDHLQIRER